MSSIKVPELKKLIADEPNLVVIDIRTERELADGFIPKALWMDVSSPEFMKNINNLPKDKTYCLYCASGGRTGMVIPFMEMNGFSKVYDLEGGIMSWILSGNELALK